MFFKFKIGFFFSTTILSLTLFTVLPYYFISNTDSKAHLSLLANTKYYMEILPKFYRQSIYNIPSYISSYNSIRKMSTLENTVNTPKRGAALFLPHGGGPMPLLNDSSQIQLTKYLREKAAKDLGLQDLKSENKPKGLIVVSAHWETSEVSVSLKENNKLLYDYYGFPPETYNLNFKAKGSKKIGLQIDQTLTEAGFTVHTELSRGWDHGLFVPLLCVFPNGLPDDIPVIEVSVLASQNASQLIKLGKALAPLRDLGYAIVGSGMSFHNFDGFFANDPAKIKKYKKANQDFEQELYDTLSSSKYSSTVERLDSLKQWTFWSGAKECQPPKGAEHFSPLVVLAATSLTDEPAKRTAFIDVLNYKVSAYTFN